MFIVHCSHDGEGGTVRHGYVEENNDGPRGGINATLIPYLSPVDLTLKVKSRCYGPGFIAYF
jgi:hypothetical protein